VKVFVKTSHHIKASDIYILTIKFIEGVKILPGDTYKGETNPGIIFKMKSPVLGSYNYTDDSFDITIETPAVSLSEFNEKTFIKI
jgi:hypothetical protein